MATARKTTTRKKAAPKAATLADIETLLNSITDADSESGEYEYENIAVEIRGHYYRITNDGDEIEEVYSLDEVRTELQRILELASPLKVKDVEATGYSDDAEVDSNGVTVGCTTVPFSKFDEIAAMVAKYRAKN
jgi:hypothetical protein